MNYRLQKAKRRYQSEGLTSLISSAARNVLPHPINRWMSLAETEATTMSRFPMAKRRRLSLWRRGFLSQSDALYQLKDIDESEYLTDYQRYVKTPTINGQWSVVVGNKLLFHHAMQDFDDHLPALYGFLRNGRLHHIDRDQTVGTSDPVAWITDYLRREGKLVLKYLKGGGGSRVYICTYENGTYSLNGEALSHEAFAEMVSSLEEHLVTEFVEQAEYAEAIYPESPNTVRALTMYDEEADEAFLAGQMHRFGTTDSGALDNFSQGGLSAGLDAETGELSEAVQFPYSGERTWYRSHPDTGAPIAGVDVPGWDRIADRLLEIATSLSYIPYIGWDIIVTNPGEFTIIEANNHTNTRSIQVHQPLLANERVRRFYERHGVL